MHAHTHTVAVAWQMRGNSLSCNNSITRYQPHLYSLNSVVGFFQRLGVLAGPTGSAGACRCSSPLKIKALCADV